MQKKLATLAALFWCFLPLFAGAAPDDGDATDLKTFSQRFSYSYGLEVATRMKTLGADIDLESLFMGIRDQYTGAGLAIPVEEAVKIRNEFNRQKNEKMRQKRQKVAAANLAASSAFLQDNQGKKGIKETANGLQYEVIKEGDGPKPALTDRVAMHYIGTLLDGTEFDNSYKRDKPVVFPMAPNKTIIPGWTEGMHLMRVGSKYRLFIPPNLGYGNRQAGPVITPNSLLIFEVEMMSIEEAPQATQ